MKQTLLEAMKRHPPHHPAVITEGGGVWSYARLLDQVRSLSAVQEPRRIVFCLCSNTPGSLLGYLAFLQAGAVPLLLPTALDERLLEGLVARYRPGALWVPRELAGRFLHFARGEAAEGYVLLHTGFASYPVHPELALLLTTSGSTGSPKLVRQSMRNLLSNARAISEYLELTLDERPITTLPMHYTYGLSVLHSHLLSGGCILLTGRSVLEPAFWDFFRANGGTSLSGVPATYDMLRRLGFFERTLPSLRSFTQAGGRLSTAMHRMCAEYAGERGLRFYAMYGQTEATARMSYLPWRRSLEKCGSIGVPIPGGSFALIDEDGRELEGPDASGQLVYRGENVTLGYAQGPEDLAKGDENGGVLYTGDLARRDGEGYYYITGRIKRFLKLAGSRVSLDECEELLRASFPEGEWACCGSDDRLLVFSTGDQEAAEAALALLCDRLRLAPAAVRVRRVESIPRSEAGKILYPELEALT